MTELINFFNNNIGKNLYYEKHNPRFIILKSVKLKDDIIELYSGNEPSLSIPLPFSYVVNDKELTLNYCINDLPFINEDDKKYLLELADSVKEELSTAFIKHRFLFFNRKITFYFKE